MSATKRVIVALAVCRLIPEGLAQWLIRNLGLLHA
jgi:hypothetical protein